MSLTPALDRETVMARARDAALSRTKFVEALIDAAQAAAAAHEKAAEATRTAARADAEHADAYKDALDAGWTAAELKDSGLIAPTPVGKKPSKTSAKRTTGRGTPRRRVGAENTAGPDRQHNDDVASSPTPDVSTEPQSSTTPAH
ncbi:hypothetical protein A2J03_22095 [Rhodococcus sp. EPR-157]|uniref:hypothetical protein n=1 Tax=Rhodococcus sp. EPR-157 TaxID=1813677 RepID=UPI0007BBABD2|nr:hypothetical protein [Rhodococcus sp. EPR-157]KZF07898.1 hypothetical protein A2J03_22095 [Rhodococcus sp. EPR-157]